MEVITGRARKNFDVFSRGNFARIPAKWGWVSHRRKRRLRPVTAEGGPDLVHALKYAPFIHQLHYSMGCCGSTPIDNSAEEVVVTEPKPANKAASPETKNSTARSDKQSPDSFTGA